AGAVAVAVRERRRLVGLTLRRGPAAPGLPLGARLAAALPAESRRALDALAAVSPAAWLVGGVVRDVVRGAAIGRDLDVVVEGDGPAVAHALAARLGGRALEHARFRTATVEAGGVRVDVATARTERYEAPGALPRVIPSGIGEDLGRRDFTVNAMAADLGSSDVALLDPFGGRADLVAHRLRVLHPLSFVEDPTRMFRAARYAARLEMSIDRWTAAAQALALRLGPYPALSSARLHAELELIAGDARPDVALRRLGAAGVFRLFAAEYRFTRRTAAILAALPDTLAWVRQGHLAVAGGELAALAVLADQAPAVRLAALRRLGIAGGPLAHVVRAAQGGDPLVGAETPSARAARLRRLEPIELAWLWLSRPERRAALGWWAGTGRGVRGQLRGDDVMALGVPRGPEVARVLAALRDARLDGGLRSRDDEIAYVRSHGAATTRKEG
ncbi:MAG: CCA tRNA nucleotidyltransferase, partial [Candidatus Rokubacteria bacterium]|nr:CCA tRNA nucleotidyltransferase [Candidatus Rokubacteria bacterium]